MPVIRSPDTKGKSAREVCRVEVDFLLDLITHNVGAHVPWGLVADGLNRIRAVLDGKRASIESIDNIADESKSTDLKEARASALLWRKRAEASEQRVKEMRATEEKNAADYRKLFAEMRGAQETIGRLKKEVETAPAALPDCKRALEKMKPIVEAMLAHFKPAPGKETPLWGDEGADPKAFDADGVAYGEKIGIGELRYGDLEVARGAMYGVGV